MRASSHKRENRATDPALTYEAFWGAPAPHTVGYFGTDRTLKAKRPTGPVRGLFIYLAEPKGLSPNSGTNEKAVE